MTVRELSQLYWLKKEIAIDQQRLELLRSKASGPSNSNLSSLPNRNNSFDHRLERLCSEILDLESIIYQKQQMCIQEQTRLEQYISNLPDSLLRQVFTFRFIEGLSWLQVAFRVGGGNTEASVKMLCYRYLKSENKNYKKLQCHTSNSASSEEKQFFL